MTTTITCWDVMVIQGKVLLSIFELSIAARNNFGSIFLKIYTDQLELLIFYIVRIFIFRIFYRNAICFSWQVKLKAKTKVRYLEEQDFCRLLLHMPQFSSTCQWSRRLFWCCTSAKSYQTIMSLIECLDLFSIKRMSTFNRFLDMESVFFNQTMV